MLRCQIVLAAAEGHVNVDIAEGLGCHPSTVSKWRKRFAEQRMYGLSDAPRSGPPRTITDEEVNNVVRKTLDETPENATHWSVRSMAEATGMSRSAVHRIWTAFRLQPHIVKKFNVSSDPFFTEKVRDVVGLYLNPPDAGCGRCVWMRKPRSRPCRLTVWCCR